MLTDVDKIHGSGVPNGKMFLVRIIENYNNKIDAYFRSG